MVAMYGATIGRLAILGVSATVNQACAALTKPKKVNILFAFYWLLMYRPMLAKYTEGGGQPNLSREDIKGLKIATPPIEEQEEIAKYIERKSFIISSLLSNIEKSNQLLYEYRSALISAAVTGKIDVRQEAAA